MYLLTFKWESLLHHIDTYLYWTTHTYTGDFTENACLKSLSRRLLIQGQTVLAQLTRSSRKPTALISLVERIWGGNTGRSQTMRHESTYKGMTPSSIQNFKTLGLWILFIICCSTFSFIPNVGLRLTLEYLTYIIEDFFFNFGV